MARRGRRGVSPGTVLMLILTAAVAAGFAVVFPVLLGDVDLAVIQLDATVQGQSPELGVQEIRLTNPATPTPSPVQVVMTEEPAFAGGTFSLTAGGTVAVEKGVRQAGYFSAAKRYDYDDVFSLVREDMQGDVSLVTLENLVVPSSKMSTLVVPGEVMRMLRLGNVNTVALGFPATWEQGTAGVASTLDAAWGEKLRTLGAFLEPPEGPGASIVEIRGVKVALLHFTMSPSNNSKKALKKDGRSGLYPLTDQAAADIAAARAAGAQAVIVSVHWGKKNASAPTAAQKTLAREMAEAGADVILGSGARNVQGVEWLTVTRKDGTEGKTLCAWCLGNLLSDSRENNAVAGMLLHLTVTVDEQGEVSVGEVTYTPTFIWRFSLDGVTCYRVIPAAGEAPDGLDRDQTNARTKAAERVAKKLGDSPVRLAE